MQHPEYESLLKVLEKMAIDLYSRFIDPSSPSAVPDIQEKDRNAIKSLLDSGVYHPNIFKIPKSISTKYFKVNVHEVFLRKTYEEKLSQGLYSITFNVVRDCLQGRKWCSLQV